MKKKNHEKLVAQVKKLELMIKEQRRINERLKDGVAEKRQACQKQHNLTDRIYAFDAHRSETQLNLSISLDPSRSGILP